MERIIPPGPPALARACVTSHLKPFGPFRPCRHRKPLTANTFPRTPCQELKPTGARFGPVGPALQEKQDRGVRGAGGHPRHSTSAIRSPIQRMTLTAMLLPSAL